jgi:hypothetical protein
MKTVKSQPKSTAPARPSSEDRPKHGLPGTPAERSARIKAAAKANRETMRRLAK